MGNICISVVIPAYNEAEYLQHSLPKIKESLTNNTIDRLEWELIVCDNGSTDHTAKVAQAHGAKVVGESERQISRARNRGATVASGNWLLFLDADSWPSLKLIEDVHATIKSGKFVGCGSTIKAIDGPLWCQRALFASALCVADQLGDQGESSAAGFLV